MQGTFKLLLKFRNVLKHSERRSSLACNQNIKDDIPTELEVFLCFETKRNDINSPRKHSRNARVISAEELGTMSKNNLRGITLDIGPMLGIHSLTLIISCKHLMTSTEGNSHFYFPRISMFLETRVEGDIEIRIRGKQNSPFPKGPVIKRFAI